MIYEFIYAKLSKKDLDNI